MKSQAARTAMLALVIWACFGPVLHADEKTAAVDKLFEKWDKPDLPGCSIAIIKDGQIVYKRGYGMADLDHDIPI